MGLELDRYYAEGCVLQRGAPVAVRGRAVPGARVRVELPGGAERLAEGDRMLEAHRGRLEVHRAEVEAYREAFARAFAGGKLPPNEGPALYEGQLFVPGGGYNALVAPLTRHPVAGWLWYQGESNATRADAYGERLKALIGEYRERWGLPQAPFIVVQLPGHAPAPAEEAGTGRTGATWAWLREQQRRVVMETPRTALVATLDAGGARRIHPRDKRPVGRRCADAARALQEGREPWLAPARAERHGAGAVAIRFNRPLAPEDLVIEPGCAFELLDAAGAAVRDGRLVIAHPAAMASREIRYAFSNNPAPALFDRAGTPVPPFRMEIEP